MALVGIALPKFSPPGPQGMSGMNPVRWFALLAALLAPMAASAQPSAARCLSEFLAQDGDWQARSLDGHAIDGGAFTPVQSLFVRDGHVHAAVWRSEPTSARLVSVGGELRLELFYPAVLPGIEDANARRLQPFAESEHRLVIPGRCSGPDAFTIEITAEGRTRSVGFVRVATSKAEFQEPTNGSL